MKENKEIRGKMMTRLEGNEKQIKSGETTKSVHIWSFNFVIKLEPRNLIPIRAKQEQSRLLTQLLLCVP